MNRKKFAVLLLICMLLTGAFGGCATREPEPTPEPTPAPTPEPTPTPTPEPTPERERTLTVYGKEFSSFDEELDLSGIEITDGAAELEALIPELTHLKLVIMSDCGIPDEEMDALNKKYEDIRFIWTIHFGAVYHLRTDDTSFIASLFEGKEYNYSKLYDKDVECLKYCTDMVALDIGHMGYTNVEFCAYMPHLRYLIIADTPVEDITPLAGLEELWYLEAFCCNFTDVSPLLSCKNLRHLNLCYCNILDAEEDLAQMDWLERLWYVGPYMTPSAFAALRDNLPNTYKTIGMSGDSTGGGWRQHDAYLEMRDAFGVYYLR